jgi:hypothetical protein
MAEYDPPVKEEPVVEPEAEVEDKPDLDTLLEAERQKVAAREIEIGKQSAAYDARMSQLETMLQDRFAGKTPPPTEDVSDEPVVTEDDFLTPAGSVEATRKLANAAASEMGQTIDATYRNEILELRSDQFDAKFEKIQAKEYYKYVKDEMDAAIKSNPKLRYAPKTLDILYNNLVGEKTKDILVSETAAAEAAAQVNSLPVAPRSHPAAPSGPIVSTTAPEHGPLNVVHEEMRQKFSKIGVKMDAEKWARSLRERSGMPDIPEMEEKR